jgi:mannose-6-phosphate isomerase-like protein (cupin superfamily)
MNTAPGEGPYSRWLTREGLPVYEAVAINPFDVETGEWARYGARGAVCHLGGNDDPCALFVLAVEAGRATLPVRHLYEAAYYVLDGRGSTEFEFADGRRRCFAWGPGSLFSIPLNVRHQHVNVGTRRALLTATVTAPLVMNLFGRENLVFGMDFDFAHACEEHGVADLFSTELGNWNDDGVGSASSIRAWAEGALRAQISEIRCASYQKAPREMRSPHIMLLSKGGYSLLWEPGDDEFTRVLWRRGTVFVPSWQQFHQHFATGNKHTRCLQTGLMTTDVSRLPFRGDRIDFADQDARIHVM